MGKGPKRSSKVVLILDFPVIVGRKLSLFMSFCSTLFSSFFVDSSNSESTSTPIKQEFDFLIKDKLVTDTLEKHIAENQLSTEEVLQIECVKRNPKPSLTHEMDHKDWVSGLHCYKNL